MVLCVYHYNFIFYNRLLVSSGLEWRVVFFVYLKRWEIETISSFLGMADWIQALVIIINNSIHANIFSGHSGDWVYLDCTRGLVCKSY